MGTIQIQNLSFKYPNMVQNLFDQVNLQIDESWKLGLIGRNGRGKTTLFKIIQGQLSYQGEIITNLNFTYFPQEIKDKKQSAQEVALQIAGLEDYDLWQIQVEMAKLNLADEILLLPFQELSPGQQTKLQLAAMFTNQNDFQLLDEPTNHLDIQGRQTVEKYLQAKQGFIVISHDQQFLNKVIDHVISINRNDIKVYRGNFDTWQDNKTHQDEFELQEKKKLQKEIKKLKESAVKKENWSQQKEKDKYKKPGMENAKLDKGFIGSRAARVMKRAKQIEQRADNDVAAKEELLKNIEVEEPLRLNYQDDVHTKEILTVKDLQLNFDQKVLNKPLTFKMKKGEIVALVGVNGTGKSTFLKKLLQITAAQATGEYQFNKNLKVAYLSQDANELSGTISELAEEKDLSETDIFNNLRKLGFERELFHNRVETMSQGQKKKVALAITLLIPADFYIFDEPLNYLDVITRSQIIEVIKKYHPSMLLVEHDQTFIDEIADKKITFEPGNTIETDA